MNEREKYKAEIQAGLLRLGETLHEIKVKQEKRKEGPPHLHMEPIFQMHEEANQKLEEIEEVDESAWGKFKSEMDNLVNDIDKGIRKALAYFG